MILGTSASLTVSPSSTFLAMALSTLFIVLLANFCVTLSTPNLTVTPPNAPTPAIVAVSTGSTSPVVLNCSEAE